MVPASGFQCSWDNCSATPFLYRQADDGESLPIKDAFAKKTGVLGVNMFDVHGKTDEWNLIMATRKTLLGPWHLNLHPL